MRIAVVAACLAAALLAAGCGEKEEQVGPGRAEPFELLLDFFPNADHAGIYAAQADGRFRDVGLDVRIRTPSDPSAPIKQVAAGRVDLAISYEPEVLRARDQGLPVVSVAALVRAPLTSIISLPKAGIRRPADLAGKTVGTAGIDYQSAYLRTILQHAHVDPDRVRERDVGFNLVPALATGKVDAILGGYWNYEAIDLRQRGKDPRVIRVEDAGVPTYDELVLVANVKALNTRGGRDRVRRFIGALAAGTRDLARNPDRGVKALLEANRELDPKLQRASVRATLPLLRPAAGKPYGWQDPAAWRAFAQWMHENALLERPPDVATAFTNTLLPGVGL
jgi:putative hydroxymethylpyrimidine transport system substrate-binding protein